MRFEIKSVWARWVLIALEVIVFLAAAGWIGKTYEAYDFSRKPTLRNLQLAVRLDPGNAEYHLMLGRLHQYNPTDTQPEKAMEEFRLAVQLDPYNPEGWANLAAALEFQGKMSQAEQCLRRADSLAPNLPAYQWPIANFYLLQGNVDEAFKHFKVCLAGTSQFDQIIFRTAWKASGDPNMILEQLIPQQASTEFSYLYYLLSQQRFTEARAVWSRLMRGSEKFTAQQTGGYIDALINTRQPEAAYKVWTDLEKKGLIRGSAPGPDESLVTNGDFEDEILNMGFGWRIAPMEGLYAGLDQSTFHSPSHSLLVQFPGKQNLDYRQVYQYVKVSPGRSYQLQAFLKTDGITTDSGPRLEVRDVYDAAALDKFSEDLTGSTPSWNPVTLDFKTGPKTELIIVILARLPSRKLDNQIAGRVWLDDVRLTPATN